MSRSWSWAAVDIPFVMSVAPGPMKLQCVLTSSLMKVHQFDPALPFNDYFQYFGPDYRLEVPATNMENLNSREYLDRTTSNLSNIETPYWNNCVT
jgi:hypothetical protein